MPTAPGVRPLRPSTPTPFIHTVSVGGRRLVLDLLSGEGRVDTPCTGPGRPRPGPRLPAHEERLLLLDWTRRLMPVPSAQPLWDVEAAALASATASPDWSRRTRPGLAAALSSLMERRDTLSGRAEHLVRRAWRALEDDVLPAEVLAPLIEELRGSLPRRADDDTAPPAAGCAPPGHGELEWDRHPGFALDPREDAVRSGLFPTVWAAAVPGRREPDADAGSALWARLVDLASGAVHDEARMTARGGAFVARGFVPAQARGTRVRVDVTSRPDLPPRTAAARTLVLAEQAWFRALLLGRRAAAHRAWGPAAAAQRRRAEARVVEVLGTAGREADGSRVRLPSTLAEAPPFLAETALRLEQLTTG